MEDTPHKVTTRAVDVLIDTIYTYRCAYSAIGI